MGYLRGGPNGELIGVGIILGNYRPRLHGIRDQALSDCAQFNHRVGSSKSGVHVASRGLPNESPIVLPGLVEDWGVVAQSSLGISDCRQWLVVHLDCLQSIGRHIGVLGHYHRNGITHVTDLARRQRIAFRLFELHEPLRPRLRDHR